MNIIPYNELRKISPEKARELIKKFSKQPTEMSQKLLKY